MIKITRPKVLTLTRNRLTYKIKKAIGFDSRSSEKSLRIYQGRNRRTSICWGPSSFRCPERRLRVEWETKSQWIYGQSSFHHFPISVFKRPLRLLCHDNSNEIRLQKEAMVGCALDFCWPVMEFGRYSLIHVNSGLDILHIISWINWILIKEYEIQLFCVFQK